MLVGVYIDKGRVSDTLESAETIVSETLWRHFKSSLDKEQLLFGHVLLHRKPMFCIELFS